MTFGKVYGSTALSHLHGGSGGGAASATGGGAGGGAISLEADGNGTLTILSGGLISANGGSVSDSSANGGGGGYGGSIRLAGKAITNNGTIRAMGGSPQSGGIGGGGRIAFNYSTNLTEGTVNVGSGAYEGTIGYNTPQLVSSGSTASVTFSNDNYRKHSATRYDDLVYGTPSMKQKAPRLWTTQKMAGDATLKNMTIANRVGGKIGRGLSFTTRVPKHPVTQADSISIWDPGLLGVLILYPLGSRQMNGAVEHLSFSLQVMIPYTFVSPHKLREWSLHMQSTDLQVGMNGTLP